MDNMILAEFPQINRASHYKEYNTFIDLEHDLAIMEVSRLEAKEAGWTGYPYTDSKVTLDDLIITELSTQITLN